MSTLTSDDNAASELIGYVYTASISVLILSSMMLTSSTMLNGNITNTAQEDAEQIAHYFQLSIEDLLNTVREYPDSSPVVKIPVGIESIDIKQIKYKVNGTEGGLKITTIQPRGGSFEVTFPLEPATAIQTDSGKSLISTTSYIVAYYDANLKVITLTSE